MVLRRKRSKPHSFEQQLENASQQAKQQAAELPAGQQRTELLEKARQIDAAAKLNAWLSPSELRPAR